jgi:beta-mannosidase
MDHHNKQVEGPERLLRFLAAHHELTADFREFIFRTQLVQAEALKCAVEHWRRRKFRTAGVLFWQLNDCWPVSSWAVIDSELRPKLAYYYARRFYAPVLASLRREGNDVSAWVTNDLLTRAEGTLTVTLRSFDGHARQLVTRAVRIAANRSVRALRIPAPALDASARARSYLHVELRSGGKVTAENRLYFAEPKHQRLPKTRLRLRVVRTGEGRFSIYLSSSAFARAVTILLDDPQAVFSDNCFDLDAGATRCVELITDRSLGALRKMLTVHSLQS